jgi:redox-sensitive bicupin YhaK (pirin superfamily)
LRPPGRHLYDTHVSDGESIDLPSKDGFDHWFYVFDGEVSVGEQALGKYHALVVGANHSPVTATATKDSDLVVFLVDRSAKFSREGTMSG